MITSGSAGPIENYKAKVKILHRIGDPYMIEDWNNYPYERGDRYLAEYLDFFFDLAIIGVENGELLDDDKETTKRIKRFYFRTTEKMIQEIDDPAGGVILKSDGSVYTSAKYKSDLEIVWDDMTERMREISNDPAIS